MVSDPSVNSSIPVGQLYQLPIWNGKSQSCPTTFSVGHFCEMPSLNLAAARQGVGDGAGTGILQFTPNRNTMGNAGGAQVARPHHLADVMGGRLTFDRQV